jgi:DNA repair protein RecO (recombination protein O)
MPARETEAIILRTFPLGEADRLVSFLGRTSGKLRGVASGARRLKNRFGSTLELLSHVRLWYVERETRELVRIQQCELLESFHRAQSDYALSTGLAAVSEIVERVMPEREAGEPMFRLALLTAREIERRESCLVPLAYFAFWTLKLGGWLPPLDRCSSCGNSLSGRGAFQWPSDPGLFCETCRRSGMRLLSCEGRELGQRFLTVRLDQFELPQGQENAAQELREAALNWIEFHIEKKLQTRELLENS